MKLYKSILGILSCGCLLAHILTDSKVATIFLLITASMELGAMIAEVIMKREGR